MCRIQRRRCCGRGRGSRDRGGQLANAGGEVTGEGPQEGQRRVRVPERRLGDLQRGREQLDRALEVLLFAGERPCDGVEVADQALELRLVAGSLTIAESFAAVCP